MKLFWKYLLSILGLVMFSFSMFGVVLIYSSFQQNLQNEKRQGEQLQRVCQYSLLESLQTIPREYKQRDGAVVKIAENIQANLVSEDTILKLYLSDDSLLYQSRPFESALDAKVLTPGMGKQMVTKHGEEHYLESVVSISGEFGDYRLELDHNIEHIYRERKVLLKRYQSILLLVFLVTLVLATILSAKLARPMQKLAGAAGELADGNYAIRVKKQGRDEVASLVDAFNKMAVQLEENMAQLQASVKKQEAFTGAFAHELKTPLTSIIGYADAMNSMELSEEERRQSAEFIFRQGKRLEALSYKMLELTGISEGTWKFERISAEKLIHNSVQMMAKACEKNRIQMDVRIEPGEVFGDEILLESFFTNLIDNARKASWEESRIEIEGVKEERGYRFTVRDYGRGIPKEELSRITEAFYMVDKSRARKEGGAGLGMALCEKILFLHHGTWKIESEVQKGTRVFVWLPGEVE